MRRFSIILLLALIAVAFVAGWCSRPPTVAENAIVVQRDTLYISDTVHIDHFREVTKMITDTVYLAITDTISINDTVYLPLLREIKVYEDSLFRAQVSGIQPNLDWAEVYPQTKIVTEYIEVKKRKPWGIGVSVGYGFGLQNNVVYATPYIGMGITYDIFSW